MESEHIRGNSIMGSDHIDCTVISSMFSYGASRCEPRPTELKGLMRYIYRVASQNMRGSALYARESAAFGGKVDDGRLESTLRPSPICLQMKCKKKDCEKQLLMLHDNKDPKIKHPDGKKVQNYPKLCYQPESVFDVRITMRPNLPEGSLPCEFYKNIFLLSMVLGGIGKRSRRGRGCMTTGELEQILREDLPSRIRDWLNEINLANGGNNAYRINGGNDVIFATSTENMSEIHRPVIEEIRIGKNFADIRCFLKNVDEASHVIESGYMKRAIGFVKRGRFASSVIVSVTKIRDGYFPVYTFVKPIFRGSPLDPEKSEREAFLQKIEGANI